MQKASTALGLPALLHGVVHQPGGDHGATDQPADEIQPAHRIAAKLGEVQTGHYALGEQAGARRRWRLEQFAGNAAEGDAFALGQFDTAAQQRACGHLGIGSPGIVDRQPGQRAGTIVLFGPGDELLQRQQFGRCRWGPLAAALPFLSAWRLLLCRAGAPVAEHGVAVTVVKRIQRRRHVDE